MGRVNYPLKNVCKRSSVATTPVLVDLFLLCCTLINKTHTRPYKLPRVRLDAARLLEREPYQEWQWASFLHTSFLRPCYPSSGLAWDAHAVSPKWMPLCLVWCKPKTAQNGREMLWYLEKKPPVSYAPAAPHTCS